MFNLDNEKNTTALLNNWKQTNYLLKNFKCKTA